MADVWKSNPRHYCKFCKCWIADNKPSRDFHEKGKKHQENVQLKIAEIRKKSVQDEKKKNEENSYMREMEEAAKAAFLKDLKEDPKLARQYLEKAKAKKRTVADAMSNKTKTEPSSSKKEEIAETEGKWHLTYSPEGYPYYWNDITAEVSWTLPEGVDVVEDTPEHTDNSTTDNTNVTKTHEHADNGTIDNTDATNTLEQTDDEKIDTKEVVQGNIQPDDEVGQTQENHKDSKNDSSTDHNVENTNQNNEEAKDIDPNDISSIPLPGEILPSENNTLVTEDTNTDSEPESGTERKSNTTSRAHNSAYGQWEQIQEEEQEEIDLQLPKTEENVKPQVIVVSEPKFKVRQKKHDPLGTGLVEFKKRKLNSHNLKKRSDSN